MQNKEFLTLTDIEDVLCLAKEFEANPAEIVNLENCSGRVTFCDIFSDENLPPFNRSTVDGYAVTSSSTFGSSDANPSCLNFIQKYVEIGSTPEFSINHGEAARVPTGGMIPEGSNAVVMIEHAELLGTDFLEVFKPAAPGSNIIFKGDDVKAGDLIIPKGTRLRTQETGLLAALGKTRISVTRKPIIGIISTGDEIIPAEKTPVHGQIRDVNAYTLFSLIKANGGIPVFCGLVRDDFNEILEACEKGVQGCDMLLISGGSSVGARDYTLEIIKSLTGGEILVQGVSMSPGKPVIFGRSENKQIWGLPGHVGSAMIVFHVLVRPFINHISGLDPAFSETMKIPAIISKNIASANGRTDFIRVKIKNENGQIIADPVIGKSGLLFTLLKSDGIIEIPKNVEGLNQGSMVDVIPFGDNF